MSSAITCHLGQEIAVTSKKWHVYANNTNFLSVIDCSLGLSHLILSGSLALEALLIGVHCKKSYINV